MQPAVRERRAELPRGLWKEQARSAPIPLSTAAPTIAGWESSSEKTTRRGQPLPAARVALLEWAESIAPAQAGALLWCSSRLHASTLRLLQPAIELESRAGADVETRKSSVTVG